MPGRTLADQLRTAQVLVPRSTTQAAPQSTTFALGNVILVEMTVMIPPGHAGLTGINISYDGVALIPFGQPPTFLVAEAETITVPVNIEVGHPLTVVTFNTDAIYDHRFFLRALVDVLLPDPSVGAGVDLIAI